MRFKDFAKAVSLVLTTSIVLGVAGTARYVAAAGFKMSGSSTVQDYGVIDGDWDDSSATLTLKGRASKEDPYKPIEAINVNISNSTGYEGSLKYSVYVQSKGWQEFSIQLTNSNQILLSKYILVFRKYMNTKIKTQSEKECLCRDHLFSCSRTHLHKRLTKQIGTPPKRCPK